MNFIMQWIVWPIVTFFTDKVWGSVLSIYYSYQQNKADESQNKADREKIENAETEEERTDATEDLSRDAF